MACLIANRKYGKNGGREDVKTHHYICLLYTSQRLNVEFPAQRLPQEIIDRPGIDLNHPALFEELVQVLAHQMCIRDRQNSGRNR